MNFRPKWQFYKTIQAPLTEPSSIAFLATFSYPSPIDTLSQGYFFFFLAKSSIEDVGSAPADSKNNTGSKNVLSAQILSIV